jgi:hypothetical protein
LLTCVGIAAAAAAPTAPVGHIQPTSTISQSTQLAAEEVPLGGLLTSFLNNQAVYCSIICPLLVDTAVTGAVTTAEAPTVFLAALGSGNILQAIGIAAASVTGPTNAAAAAAILADGSLVAPRAQNAFEVAVIGLLDIVPAASGGLPGILEAIQSVRQDTFDALNAPIVPNPTPTVTPTGGLQVAAVGAMNVVAAIIFPGFNDILGAAFSAPDAAAQELAASGDPVRAAAAGIASASRSFNDAVSVVQEAVRTAVDDIRAEAGAPSSAPVAASTATVTSAAVSAAAMSSVARLQAPKSGVVAPAPNSGPSAASTRAHGGPKGHSAPHDVIRSVRALDR